jgi:hypothetical protein
LKISDLWEFNAALPKDRAVPPWLGMDIPAAAHNRRPYAITALLFDTRNGSMHWKLPGAGSGCPQSLIDRGSGSALASMVASGEPGGAGDARQEQSQMLPADREEPS